MTIMENYNHSDYGIKSSLLKTLLILEYGDSIGFHVQHQKKELRLVGSTVVESKTISSSLL